MRLVTGYWQFKTLAAAVDLDLFTRLSGGRRLTLEEVCSELGLAERPADMFLAACASLGLLEKEGTRYRNSPLTEEFLVRGRPNYFGGQVRYCDERTYLAWHRIGEALRTDRPLTWDPDKQRSLFDTAEPGMLEMFWEAMHSCSIFTARALGGAYNFTPHKRMLDLGGGSGAFPIALCQMYTHLEATIYDLAHVCPIARAKVASANLAHRVDVMDGDFITNAELPSGYDVILLSMILHDADEATNRTLLRKCHDALFPGGVVIISELLLDDDRTGPAEAALMGLNMVVETKSGRNYSEGEYSRWLSVLGFTNVHRIDFEAPGSNGAIVGKKR